MQFDEQQRRQALQAFIDRTGLKVSPWEKEAGLGDGTLRKFMDKVSHTLTDRTYQRLAAAATALCARQVSVPELQGLEAVQTSFLQPTRGRQGMAEPTPPPLLALDPNVAVYASAQGGEDGLGAMVLSSEPVAFILRPPPLNGIAGAYAVYISGFSMSPAYEDGDLALVNPSLPPRPNNFCIFQGARPDGSPLALVKRLVRETSNGWQVRQYEPAKTFTLQRPTWGRPHVIVGKYERV